MREVAGDTTTPTLLLVIQSDGFVFSGHAANYFLLIFVILVLFPTNMVYVRTQTIINKKQFFYHTFLDVIACDM